MNKFSLDINLRERHNTQLKEALYLAEYAVDINRSDIFLDTLAEVYFKMDRKNELFL